MTDLTIGITAHSEGITLHKTLLSVERASKLLIEAAVNFEIILQLDNPTAETTSYANRIKDLVGLPIIIRSSSFGDPGLARNEIVKSATGKYVTFIDGDDLMSENWLIRGYQLLKDNEPTEGVNKHVAHTELTVEFGEADTVVVKQGEIDKTTDSLLSVYANRWNVVMMIERSFLAENPYPSSPKGYGFEDWYINCQTIYNDFHNLLAPKTVLFVRRKLTDSVWLEQKNSCNVLRKNPLLSFKYIRSLTASTFIEDRYSQLPPSEISLRTKVLLARHSHVDRIVKKTYHLARKTLKSKTSRNTPTWLHQEWTNQHLIDKNLFPNLSPDFYETISLEHYQAATVYKQIIDSLSHDSYDYILFLPWVIKGGADLFAINYANSIARAEPSKNVLVITTLNAISPWKNKLSSEIDVVDFGILTHNLHPSVQTRVMEHLIENSGASNLHIMNSEFAYNFIISHSQYIKESQKKLVVTSFSQSTNNIGRIFGYSHTHVPLVYDLAQLITTDNKAVADMWVSEYGFDRSKIRVHSQPIHLPNLTLLPKNKHDDPTRILWASRLCPEKQPKLVIDIANKLKDSNVHIDMYGQIDDDFNVEFLKQLPSNVTYHGSYDGFSSLNPTSYDIYLYTSLFDGMPNSVLEAGSYSLPVVASSVGGLPELIHHQKNGMLVKDIKNAQEYADYIKELVDNKDRAMEIGAAMRKQLEKNFSEESHKRDIIELLKELKYL